MVIQYGLMSKSELNRVVLRVFWQMQLAVLPAVVPMVYMVVLIMGLEGELAWKIAVRNVTWILPLFGTVIPWLLAVNVTKGALETRPSDKPGDRLKRILEAPRRIEVGLIWNYGASSFCFAVWPPFVYGLDPWTIPQVVISFVLLVGLVMIWQSLRVEAVFRPYALEEFHKHPQVRPEGRGFTWAKQRWYLPYCFALYVVCTLLVTGMIIAKKAQAGFGALFSDMQSMVSPEVMTLMTERVQGIQGSMVMPVLLVGGFLVVTAAVSAMQLANHQRAGTDAVGNSIESLVSGRPSLPNWVSTDEVGELSSATAIAFERLRAFSFSLGESAQMLGGCAEQLNDSHRLQTQSLSVQATALQETQVTAQEIKQTSMVASQKAESVLQQAERADQIGRAGENALVQSLSGLEEIQQQVLQMAQSIRSLDERTQQIANITTTVKDLADRSNMLALNAAIEAVRSGEHGKGFGVVAREIRSLADQSIRATYNVRDVLEQLSTAIRNTAAMSEQGSEKVTTSLAQVQTFGDNIRQLSGIVRDNASAVRQISAAVTQQNSGIGQIFQAVNDLTKIMDQTMASMRTSDDAAGQMRIVAARVNGFVEQYGWQDSPSSSTSDSGGAPGKKRTTLSRLPAVGGSGSDSGSSGSMDNSANG